MFRFRVIVASIILSQAVSVLAGTAEELIFKNSFERCDNFTIPPGAVEWDGGGDGESWSDPQNWKGNVIPADNDSVAIADEGGITVIYDSSLGTTMLNAMDLCESLRITGGALDISGSSSVRTNLELTSGSLIANGNLWVSGTFTQSGNSTLDGSGTVTVTGKYSWMQGNQKGSGETIAEGGIDITNNRHDLRERTLTINDISTWTGGIIYLFEGATIDNNDSFDIQTDADMTWAANPNSILNNDGTLTKSFSGDGDSVTKIGANFVNNATISVTSGELQIGRSDGNGTHTGSFTVSSGSIIGISGNHNFTGASFTGAGGFRMVNSSGMTTIGGTYTLGGPLIVNNGKASFTIPITISDDITVTGGTLELSAATTVNANVVLSGGGLIANASVPVSGTFVQSGNSTLGGSGTVTVTGKYSWMQGNQKGSGETIAEGGIDITNNRHDLRERTLTINDISTWTGGIIYLFEGATIDNNDSFDIQTDADMTWAANPNSILNNDGTLTKSFSGDGDSVTKIGANFVNNATISVTSGELQIGRSDGNGTHTGSFTVSSGSIIGISGNHNFTGASFTGAGGFRMVNSSGMTTIGGTYTLGGPLIVNNGKASFTIPITISDDITVTGGTLELSAATTVNANVVLSSGGLIANASVPVSGTFVQSGNSTLDGSGTVTVTGKYSWMQGNQKGSGETIAEGGIDITNNRHDLRERTLTINDISTWTGGIIYLFEGATIDNNDSFDIQTDADMTWAANPNSILNNDGTLTKSFSGDGDSVTKIGANFVNNATISVTSGELQIGRSDGNGTHTGSFTVSSGSIIGISGNHNFTGASFTGAGGFRMVNSSGMTTIGGTYTLGGPLIVNNGKASFTIPITISDDITVTGGTLELSAATTVNANVVLSGGGLIANASVPVSGTFVQSGNSTLDGSGTVTVTGKYSWMQGNQKGSGETIAEGGIDITNNRHDLRERTLTINDISTWTGGIIYLFEGATIDNNDSFDIQTDADMTWAANPNSILNNDGTLTKSFSGDGDSVTNIGAEVTNSGSFSVAAGSVGLQRTFTQTSTGTLFVDIASGSFDVFAITGDATLDGTLDINLLDGYEPPVTTTFEIMTFSSRTGTMTINDPSIGNGTEFQVNHGATDVTLEVVLE